MTTSLLLSLFELAVFGVGSVGLSLVGAYIEQFAISTLQSGQMILGAWAAVIGIVVLYFAYMLATDKFSTKLEEFKRSRGTAAE